MSIYTGMATKIDVVFYINELLFLYSPVLCRFLMIVCEISLVIIIIVCHNAVCFLPGYVLL